MEDYKIIERAKPEQEIHDRILEIKQMAMSSTMSKRKDIECWNMYNEVYNERDFDYLRKVGQYEFPAKLRWIGKQRKGINLLASQQSRRPFPFSIVATDVESQQRKYDTQFWSYLNEVNQKVREVNINIIKTQSAIEQRKQQLEQMLQQKPKDEQQQAQLQQLQQMLPQMEIELQDIQSQISNQLLISKKDTDKINKFFRYDYKDIREQKAQSGMKKIRTKLNVKQKSLKNFIHKCVTGKEYWFVELREGQKLPTMLPMDGLKVYYPINDEIYWIEDGDWVAIEELGSYEQVKKEFGPHLSAEQLEYLKRYRGANTPQSFLSTPGSGAFLHDNIYAGTINTSMNIRLWRIYYREERKIMARRMPNPYEDGKYFTHFVDEDDIKKKPIRKDKGEILVERYVDDLYEGVVILNDMVPYVRKKKFVWRSVDNYSYIPLPVHGKTHNNVTDRPYSLIWATKDLQILLNLIHYHRELMLAASGVKGMIMDLAQKPSSMSMEEWTYQKKIGNAWIETSRKGRQVPTSYNQFKEYDETVSASIQYMDNMIEGLDRQIMGMMGISFQRLGQMVGNDPVGTSQMAIDQSALVTEILYSEHDEVERRACTHALNLATRYCWSEGELLDITDTRNGNEFVKINKGEFDGCEFDTYLENNTREESDLNQFKQMALKEGFSGTLPFENALAIYNTDTLKELEKKMEYFKAEAQELAQQNSGNQLEAEAQKEERIIKLQQQFQAEIEGQKLQLEQAKLKIDEARLQIEQQNSAQKMELEQRKIESTQNMKVLDINSEREMEGAYLGEQNRSNQMSEQLQAMQLQLESMQLQLDSEHKDADRTSKEKLETGKIAIKKQTPGIGNKEKIGE